MLHMHETKPVKVRFAPSPTGELHVGGARTALYEYLFAKHHGGIVQLRIEDTDQKRFVPGSMDRFIDDLTWLGITFDGEPVIQSSRSERHQEIAHELVKRGAAYYEASTKQVHGQKRSDDEYRTGRTVYRGADRDRNGPLHSPLSLAKSPDGHFASVPGETTRFGYVVRLKVPEGKIKFTDLVRGEVEFDLATVDDQVLLKSDGMATYHLAAMVDDHDMEISHIIRSEEWLPSTPKHLLIFQTMGWEIPQFAHLPVILAPDGKKLSKRLHGEAVWVSTYRKQGYLPEVLINYLALLGWNPGGDRELMTMAEMIEAFSLDRVHKAGAKFDEEKLKAFQSHYVRELSDEELLEGIKNFAETTRSFDPQVVRDLGAQDDTLKRMVAVIHDRIGTLSEFPDLISFFVELPDYDPALLVFHKSDKVQTSKGLAAAKEQLDAAGDETWQSEELLSQLLDRVVAAGGFSNGDVFWPVRVALTGLERSPSPAECLWVLGKTESLSRLQRALEHLQ